MNAQVEKKEVVGMSGEEFEPEEGIPTSEIEIDTAEKALPLFETRVNGIGVVFLEAISQAALVDYIEAVLWLMEDPKPLAPFRAEYLRHVEVPGTKKFTTVSARSIIYLDPAQIIMVGPAKRSDGTPPPDDNGGAFQKLLAEIAGVSGVGEPTVPAEVILLDDKSDGDGP